MKILTRLDEIVVQIRLEYIEYVDGETIRAWVSILHNGVIRNSGLGYESVAAAEQGARAMVLAIHTLGFPVKIVNLARCNDCGESGNEDIHSSCNYSG